MFEEIIGAMPKRTIKDTVFTDLFSDKRYLVELCEALCPDEREVTEDDIKDVKLDFALVDEIYNDLGMTVRDRRVVLAEAQSTWSPNVIVRSMFYAAYTLRDYFRARGENLHAHKKIKMPRTDIFVICTGGRDPRGRLREEMSLSDEFFGGTKNGIDANITIVYGGAEDDIIYQYMGFCSVQVETVARLGRTREAILSIIRECKERGFLRDYLTSREGEVMHIMSAMFDQDEIFAAYVAEAMADEYARGIVEMGRECGLSDENILSRLSTKLNCSRTEAQDILREVQG